MFLCQCDEAHPTCNNCKKSKRECLGYDPIFKAQPTPQPHPPAPVRIQPAPSPTNNTTPSATPSLVSPPAVPTSSPLPFQTPVVPSSYPPAVDSSLAPAVKGEGSYEYSTAIDPALRGFDPSPRAFEASTRGYDRTSRGPEAAPRPVESAVPGLEPHLRSAEQPIHSRVPESSAGNYPQIKQESDRTNTGEQHHPPSRPRGGWNNALFP